MALTMCSWGSSDIKGDKRLYMGSIRKHSNLILAEFWFPCLSTRLDNSDPPYFLVEPIYCHYKERGIKKIKQSYNYLGRDVCYFLRLYSLLQVTLKLHFFVEHAGNQHSPNSNKSASQYVEAVWCNMHALGWLINEGTDIGLGGGLGLIVK